MMGRLPGDGIGLTTKALRVVVAPPPVDDELGVAPSDDLLSTGGGGGWAGGVAPRLARRDDPRSLRPRGDLRRLDLKLSRLGNLTIHDGGTIRF